MTKFVSARLIGAVIIAGMILPDQAFAVVREPSARPHKHRAAHAKRHRPRPMPATKALLVPVAKQASIEPVMPSPVGWLVTVSAKAATSPKYLGASRYGAIGLPGLSFRRPGTPVTWSSPDDSLLYAVYERPYVSFGPVLSFRGGRYSSNGGGALAGIHKSQWTLEPGVFADVWLYPEIVRVHAELRKGFRDSDGFVGVLGVDYVAKWDRFTLGVGPRAKFGNDHYMAQQFGITDADAAANPRFKPYKANAGLYSVGAFGSLSYQPSENWTYTLHGGYDRLRQDAGDSPIVKATGSKNQFSVGVIVSYTFSWDGLGWNGL